MWIKKDSLREVVESAYKKEDICGVVDIKEYIEDNKIVCEVVWCEGGNEKFYIDLVDLID